VINEYCWFRFIHSQCRSDSGRSSSALKLRETVGLKGCTKRHKLHKYRVLVNVGPVVVMTESHYLIVMLNLCRNARETYASDNQKKPALTTVQRPTPAIFLLLVTLTFGVFISKIN